VLNDNGPQLADAAIQRIRSYAGNPAAFATVSELEQYFRTVYKPYGWLSNAQWRRLAETSVRRLPDGRVTPHYDPAMVMQFTHHDDDYLRWDEWDALDIPVLCLRGEDSDLLLADTAEQMRNRGPRAVVVEIAGCGHAPALNTPAQYGRSSAFWRPEEPGFGSGSRRFAAVGPPAGIILQRRGGRRRKRRGIQDWVFCALCALRASAVKVFGNPANDRKAPTAATGRWAGGRFTGSNEAIEIVVARGLVVSADVHPAWLRGDERPGRCAGAGRDVDRGGEARAAVHGLPDPNLAGEAPGDVGIRPFGREHA
jgi:hypothetical protein